MVNSYTDLLAKANSNKQNVMIYAVVQHIPFWATFNYTNKLSSFVSESLENHPILSNGKFKHKIFYFIQTNT